MKNDLTVAAEWEPPKPQLPDLPSTVYLVILRNGLGSLDSRYKRLYLHRRFVKQFINSRRAGSYKIHVFVRDSEMGDIDWREITDEFIT